ncbi:transcription termination/antitermination NusG family protein [Crocosphaera sp.]|uniref:transcription termination/antitermination NusG family protein n=1 Tax=Crocosphaera sp. TaxID=2729996 RepID=UPI00257D598F|nr:transcription termination/antitermination NusG family protein [Crocosphaera sp.]NQZ60790.1 hypothetical protein [Crocosphaera sp.]
MINWDKVYPGSIHHNYTLQPQNGTDVAELAGMDTNNCKWYLIYTKFNAEKKMYEKIIGRGILAYLPIRKIKKKWSDRIKIIEEPAFQSYLFAKLNYDAMHVVEQLSGFMFFVSYGSPSKKTGQIDDKCFPLITDTSIGQIVKILSEFPTAVMKDNRLIKGDKVEITKGSLINYQGVLMAHPQGKTVAININGLKQSLVISIPLELLKKIA